MMLLLYRFLQGLLMLLKKKKNLLVKFYARKFCQQALSWRFDTLPYPPSSVEEVKFAHLAYRLNEPAALEFSVRSFARGFVKRDIVFED